MKKFMFFNCIVYIDYFFAVQEFNAYFIVLFMEEFNAMMHI